MKRLLLALLVLSSLTLVTVPTHAASIGANFGFTHYLPSSGDGLSVIGIPNTGTLGLFAPGLRVTQPIGASGQQWLVFDGGLTTMSASGNSLHMLGLLIGYQYAFSDAESSPYVTVGVGLNSVGGSGLSSVGNAVLGGGLGVRRRLPHGNGALRAELHVDHELDSDNTSASLTAIGLKLGFDLDL